MRSCTTEIMCHKDQLSACPDSCQQLTQIQWEPENFTTARLSRNSQTRTTPAILCQSHFVLLLFFVNFSFWRYHKLVIRQNIQDDTVKTVSETKAKKWYDTTRYDVVVTTYNYIISCCIVKLLRFRFSGRHISVLPQGS